MGQPRIMIIWAPWLHQAAPCLISNNARSACSRCRLPDLLRERVCAARARDGWRTHPCACVRACAAACVQVRNFALVYSEMAFDRAPAKERLEVVRPVAGMSRMSAAAVQDRQGPGLSQM